MREQRAKSRRRGKPGRHTLTAVTSGAGVRTFVAVARIRLEASYRSTPAFDYRGLMKPQDFRRAGLPGAHASDNAVLFAGTLWEVPFTVQQSWPGVATLNVRGSGPYSRGCFR